MCGGAASSGWLYAASTTAHGNTFAHAPHDDPRARAVVRPSVDQGGHHGVAADAPELVGEGSVIDQDEDGEDPLADGGSVLQHEALVNKEDAAWVGERVR